MSKAEQQRQSSKTIFYAGAKDQQLVLVIGNSHYQNIVLDTFQSS